MTSNAVTQTKKPPATLAIKLNQLGFRLLGKHLPSAMSRRALKLWSRTHRFPASASEKRMQLRASERSLDVNGRQIKVWKWGKGPTVILVHGWNGRGLQLHRFIDPLLNAGYRVICFDAPGHGQTDGKYTHLLEIRDVILALSERYGPFHAAIAHSFGVACLSAAINSGLTISSIVAISSPGGLSSLIGRYCQYMHVPPATEEQLRTRLSQRLGDTLWQQFAISYPLTGQVERSLIIHDKEDQLVSWQESQELSKCWPNAELILTEGLGHKRILLNSNIIKQTVAFIHDAVSFDALDEI